MKISDLLGAKFTAEELASLDAKPEFLNDVFAVRMPESLDYLPALESAKEYVAVKLQQDSRFINFAQKEFERANEVARNFIHEWKTLAAAPMLPVYSSNVEEFYGQKVQAYVDSNLARLQEEFLSFGRVSDMDALATFVNKELKNLITGIPELSAPFDEEARVRIHFNSEGSNVQQQILSSLTSEARMYLKVAFSGELVVVTVLMNTQTPLYQALRAALPEAYFFNTGRSNVAEYLEIHRINPMNFTQGVERSEK